MNCRKVFIGCAIIALVAVQGQAALIAHYTFDVDGTAAVGTAATLGSAASISTTSPAVGAGSLALSGAPTPTDTAGNDGAVSGNSFTWTSDVRTVAFWAKAASGDKGDSNATMISLGSGGGTGNRFDVRLTGDLLRLELQGGGATTATTVADGTWHHLAIVVPNATSTLGDVQYYLDGSLVGTFTGTTGIVTGIGPMRVGDGYQDTGRDFKGNLDDVRLYDEALDATAIAALVPEPATMSLLALGGMAMLRRRKK